MFFRHRFDDITGYLHHRKPYLLVDRVLEIGERQLLAESTVDAQAFYIAGHFPGAPILPGAMMQEMTTQAAGALVAANYNPMQVYNTEDPFFNEYALGVLVKVKRGRYRGFARPGDRLTITVTLLENTGTLFDFSAQIKCKELVIYRNQFQLTNIPSKTLQGEPPIRESVPS